jgi:hypothetical protein
MGAAPMLSNLKIAFCVVTTVVSFTARDGGPGFTVAAPPRDIGFADALTAGDVAGFVTVDDADVLATLESIDFALRWFGGVGLAGGKSSCETAIAMSERNRARKKRLSIQGTIQGTGS